MSDFDSMIKKQMLDAIKKLDGVAAANVNEPSPGDLARVLEHNRQLTAERDRLKAVEAAGKCYKLAAEGMERAYEKQLAYIARLEARLREALLDSKSYCGCSSCDDLIAAEMAKLREGK